MVLLTAKEVAGRLKLHPSTVCDMCRRGILPSRRIGTGRGVIRISEADLDAYLRPPAAVIPRMPEPEGSLGGLPLRPRIRH